MSTFLNVVIIQYAIAWENPAKNRSFLTEVIKKSTKANVYVLPEAFTTGFSIKNEMAETMDGETVVWMQQMAQEKNAAVMGSLIIKDGENIFNRMVFVTPDKKIQTYDKLHLFNYGDEGKCFAPGKTSVIFEYLDWKIKPIICYDLRFPVAIRNTEDYDVLICVANWPKARVEAWDTLLKARAIENQCYTIGVNRIGKDGNDLEYPGHSNSYDPLGKTLGEFSDKQTTVSFSLDKDEIQTIRRKFPFLNDRDDFKIILKSKP